MDTPIESAILAYVLACAFPGIAALVFICVVLAILYAWMAIAYVTERVCNFFKHQR